MSTVNINPLDDRDVMRFVDRASCSPHALHDIEAVAG